MSATQFKKGRARTGGRAPGQPNHVTVEIKEMARRHGPRGIEHLVAIMDNPKKADAVRIAAIKELLDRGYGKSVQPLAGDLDAPLTVVVRRFFDAPEPDVIEGEALPALPPKEGG